MTMDWQDYAALSLVAAAVAYLVRGLFKRRTMSAPCGTACGGCPPTNANEPKLVSLSPRPKQ